MTAKPDYTTLAHRYTARFPMLTYVGTQVNFWIIANLLLTAIVQTQSRIISQAYNLPLAEEFGHMAIVAVVFGISYGVIVGLAGYFLDRRLFRKLPLGKLIIFKTIISLAVLIFILTTLRYLVLDPSLSTSLYIDAFTSNEEVWRSVFFLLVIYYFFMTLVISFINQVNTKYGPGVLLPLLLGRYRDPKEEERIFIFMDLKSSTATAEKLGHLKYSAYIRDCFADINFVLYPFRAQVYQYVGDEIVVTWSEPEGLKNHFCIEFYFACRRQFRNRSEYYLRNYGLLPDFKAGAHTGPVTTVEIGDVKRDIAYHGDTLNTAARIQSVCNDHNASFIASKILLDKVGPHPNLKIRQLGMILLKGKSAKVGLVSADWADTPGDR